MPTLYVVATPIGSLEDVTLRALRILGEVGLIAAEDTRITRRLLGRHDVHTPVTSYHEHNKRSKLPSLLATLREKDVALVSDAGTPGLSDPGTELVSAAAEAGARVVPIPGPSAVTSAIAVSGLPGDDFVYLGFLPRKRGERKALLQSASAEPRTLVAFEAPHRLQSALADVLETLGDRRVTVCRELTKLHEEVFRSTVSEALAHFASPKGEFTLVIEGQGEAHAVRQAVDQEAASALLARLRGDGLGARDAVTEAVRELGISRREAYAIWLEAKEQPSGAGEDRRSKHVSDTIRRRPHTQRRDTNA